MENRLETTLARTPLSPADRRLCQELVYGIVRWQATLDWLIARKTQNRVQKPMLRVLLRMGLYQAFWLDRIPDHAVVNETVELARQFGFGSQSGFVNALLRGYLRELEPTRRLLADLKQTDAATGFSHPGWLVERWSKRWDAPSLVRLLEWNNAPPPTFARVNTLKTEPGRLIERWREEGVEYDFVRRDWLEENQVYVLKSHPPFRDLPSFQEGLFYIQDPSTLLAVSELAPRPGETVLDFCAAPGGKTTHLAQRMENQGLLVAHDVSPDRLQLVEENCRRMGVTCVKNHLPGTLPFDLKARCDRVLLDAPCSNTGVMRRRVDLRWRIRMEEIQRLHSDQLALLGAAVGFLKPGGTLVYSTCSLEPEENEAVVQEFITRNPRFRLEGSRELLPFREEADGAFVARLTLTG